MPITNRDKHSESGGLSRSTLNQAAISIARGGFAVNIPHSPTFPIKKQLDQINFLRLKNNNIPPSLSTVTGVTSLGIPSLPGMQTALQLTNNDTLMDILLTTSGSQTVENNEIKYEIFIQFDGNDKNFYDDTLALLVYRIGFLKSSSFYILRINLTPVLLEQLKYHS